MREEDYAPFIHSYFYISDSRCAFCYVNIQSLKYPVCISLLKNARNLIIYMSDVNNLNKHAC